MCTTSKFSSCLLDNCSVHSLSNLLSSHLWYSELACLLSKLSIMPEVSEIHSAEISLFINVLEILGIL